MHKAPPPPRQPGLIVYLSGVGTSVLTLWLLHMMADHGQNVMGWYANGVLPMGALMAGLLSGSGYAIASRLLNARLSRGYVLGMIATGLLDWTSTQWIDYLNLLEAQHISSSSFPFWRYLQLTAETMAFTRSGSSHAGDPLGAWGYLFKALEIAGFTGGVMIPVAILFKQPYCRACQFYLKHVMTRRLAAGAPVLTLRKASRKERKAGILDAFVQANALAAPLREQLARTSYEDTATALSTFAEKDAGTAAQVVVVLKKCPQCESHHLGWSVVSMTMDKKFATTALPATDKTAPA
jgi:uncharacterized membrane protein (UPF0136 family)